MISEYGLGRESHEELVDVFLQFSKANQDLIKALRELYCCERNNDVDDIIHHYNLAIKEEVFLKVIKWLFIMEDIIYWHYRGREFLFNLLFYNYNLLLRNGEISRNFRRPQDLERAMRRMGLEWQIC